MGGVCEKQANNLHVSCIKVGSSYITKETIATITGAFDYLGSTYHRGRCECSINSWLN